MSNRISHAAPSLSPGPTTSRSSTLTVAVAPWRSPTRTRRAASTTGPPTRAGPGINPLPPSLGFYRDADEVLPSPCAILRAAVQLPGNRSNTTTKKAPSKPQIAVSPRGPFSLRAAFAERGFHRRRTHQKVRRRLPAAPRLKFLLLYLGKRGLPDGHRPALLPRNPSRSTASVLKSEEHCRRSGHLPQTAKVEACNGDSHRTVSQQAASRLRIGQENPCKMQPRTVR
jgi:hypothetical protein